MTKRRLFIAINLPETIKKKMVDFRNKWESVLDYKLINWVKRSNLHITLVFIGYVTDDETYEICKLVKQTAKNHQSFDINLQRIILGPKDKTPRMFWVEGEKSQELANLQMDLENAISGQDLVRKEARAYSPHITLARFKPFLLKSLPEINEDFKYVVPVETIEVMQSDLHRTGPEYTILERVELGEK